MAWIEKGQSTPFENEPIDGLFFLVSSTDLPLLAAALDVSLLYFYEGEMTGHDLDQALLNEFHRLPGPETQQAECQDRTRNSPQ
jgi:hypothetical protein